MSLIFSQKMKLIRPTVSEEFADRQTVKQTNRWATSIIIEIVEWEVSLRLGGRLKIYMASAYGIDI